MKQKSFVFNWLTMNNNTKSFDNISLFSAKKKTFESIKSSLKELSSGTYGISFKNSNNASLLKFTKKSVHMCKIYFGNPFKH